jgi:hypothetical protein
MKIFVLTLKSTGEQRFYTSLLALFEENNKNVIGVSLSTLQRVKFDARAYENERVKILKNRVKTKGDIVKERANME